MKITKKHELVPKCVKLAYYLPYIIKNTFTFAGALYLRYTKKKS